MSKGFEALEEYNYFEAKHLFEKSLNKEASPAAYGLSVIYLRKDNPFHNLDSAYHYALLSVESYSKVKHKKHEKWQEDLSYNLRKAKQHREKISDIGFKVTVLENSVKGYQSFIVKYPWSSKIEQAELKRDSLAFLNAKTENTSFALSSFLEKYPDNKWVSQAQSLLYRAQYDETVMKGETETYVKFIDKYPNNPLVKEAQLQIYQIESKDNTIQSYYSFINNYSNNPHVADAWKKLYRLSISDYTRKNVEQFEKQYPDFPFPELIAEDLKLIEQQLFPFVSNNKYGFMNGEGQEKIAPSFDYAGPFNNGLAVVLDNNHFGYINKNGQIMIPIQFEEAMDFSKGRAIVQVNGMYGVIDVSGNYVLPPQFIDIGGYVEGVTYAQSPKGFQYFDLDGELAFDLIFQEAFSFNNGMAKVKTHTLNAYIDRKGNYVCKVTNGKIRYFSDSLFVHEMRDSSCLIFANGSYLENQCYDQIGVLSENRAIVEKDGKYGYINRNGEVSIPLKYIPFPNYFQFAQFKNAHVVFKKGNRYAMMDSLGGSVLPALFEGIGDYGELIPITKGDLWGYTNHNVRLKIKYQYDFAFAFIDGTAIVEKDNYFGVIDLNNEIIFPMVFESIKRVNKQLFLVKKDGRFGLYSKEGEAIVETTYQRIIELDDGLFKLVKNNEISYYNALKNKKIIANK
ncbi:WG repeat-containing protein [Brumimicrobium salinarum]|uniref:WG repeat-containing protein n=1 Tax=Brumimicrobium salinarum TaxID=2058658 RepID=UPI0013FE2F46|nr:WG repeat-containing protein [Brumimicrobium salinarum]